MYYWRKLTEKQREQMLELRKGRELPWHRPPHFDFVGSLTFIITAACFNHESIIGKSPKRMAEFESAIINACQDIGARLHAWCILPNHYHLLVHTSNIEELRKLLGQLHGRTSRQWNIEDNEIGRKVWYNYFDREMKSDRHYFASLNYVHNNAVHHGYAEKWQDWPYSSAHQFLNAVGVDEAAKIWREYPVLDYGKDWDIY